jgi:pyruvate kinase
MSYIQSYADGLFEEASECAKKSGLAAPGDMAVVTAGIPVGVTGGTNLVKLQLIK